MQDKRNVIRLGGALSLLVALGGIATAAVSTAALPAADAAAQATNGTSAQIALGQQLYRRNCAGCHKWYGGGGGGYGGAAMSLRKTGLDRDQIIMTASCGRPATGMPYHLRDAYTEEHKCYGMTKAVLGKNTPPAADNFLRPGEIAAIADYVIADIKGRGEPTLAECHAFFGEHSRVCDIYQPHPRTAPPPAASAGAGKKGG